MSATTESGPQVSLRVPPKCSRRVFTRRKEVASVSLFQTTVSRLRKPQQSARAFSPSFIDGDSRLEIQIVSMHPQNTQDSAGFAKIAADNPLKIGNSATSPVFYRFRGKQVHPDEQLHGSNESSFLKEILSRFYNSGILRILSVICQCDFFQGNVPQRVHAYCEELIIGMNRPLLKVPCCGDISGPNQTFRVSGSSRIPGTPGRRCKRPMFKGSLIGLEIPKWPLGSS